MEHLLPPSWPTPEVRLWRTAMPSSLPALQVPGRAPRITREVSRGGASEARPGLSEGVTLCYGLANGDRGGCTTRRAWSGWRARGELGVVRSDLLTAEL